MHRHVYRIMASFIGMLVISMELQMKTFRTSLPKSLGKKRMLGVERDGLDIDRYSS